MTDISIYALSTGPAPTGVAIVRVSGPAVRSVLQAFCGRVPAPRVATLCRVSRPETGDVLDEGLVLFFPGPASFTGEDVCEFHLHGGRAVIEAVLAALGERGDCRMAMRGEFSRRGFFNGKHDLVEIEGLADLIAADTEAQRGQALAQMQGQSSKLYEDFRASLIHAIALVESALDFSDEADVPEEIAGEALPFVQELRGRIARHLDDGGRGEILRDGYRVVIAGPPNAGKSRLLNALARRDVAIVSDEAGTTRDVIEVRLDVDGLPVIVSDTAGIRDAVGKVEKEGIRRSFNEVKRAALVLWMIDGAAVQLPEFEGGDFGDAARLLVWNKADLVEPPAVVRGDVDLVISAETGEGVGALLEAIGAAAAARLGQTGAGGEGAQITRARHRELLGEAVLELDQFIDGDLADTELRAEDLRRAAFAIGRLTGKVDVEDVLDKIFVEFCIGK